MTRENISTWPVKKNDKHDYYKLLHIQYNENIIMPRKKENILLSVEVKESRNPLQNAFERSYPSIIPLKGLNVKLF